MPAGHAVGIDLGMTYSVVAWLDASGKPKTILNSEGDLTTPSVVLFDGDSVVVGKEAAKAAVLEPDNVASFAKRDMGLALYSRKVAGESMPPEVIQSFVLEKLKRDAEVVIGPVQSAVVTVPAFFNEPRRKATQDAAKLAGLELLDIINEPTAAAIAYGSQIGFVDEQGRARQRERVLVYDLGGGTFDVTLMELENRDFTAIATAGDVFLGGTDWDQRLAAHVAEKFMQEHRGIDPRLDAAGLQRLLHESEEAKRSLTAREQTKITFQHVGEVVRVPISRDEFETMSADLLDRTRFTVRSVLKEAHMTWADVTRLLIVGGSSRMPMVQRMLEKESGLKCDRSLSADEAIAHGAAIYAGLLTATARGETPTMKVKNVSSHDLGVLGKEAATGRPRNSIIIPKNTVLPATKGKRFQTSKFDQRKVVINVIEGGDSSGNNATPIGSCIIKDLPPGLPAGTPVDVYFTYAENGRLTVRGQLPNLQRAAELHIERASGLTDAKLADWSNRRSRQ